MAQYTNFDFAGQRIVAANVLLFNEPQITQLFKVMLGHAWTAKMQGSLDFAHAHRTAILQQQPVDLPVLPPKRILKSHLILNVQRQASLSNSVMNMDTYNSNY